MSCGLCACRSVCLSVVFVLFVPSLPHTLSPACPHSLPSPFPPRLSPSPFPWFAPILFSFDSRHLFPGPNEGVIVGRLVLTRPVDAAIVGRLVRPGIAPIPSCSPSFLGPWLYNARAVVMYFLGLYVCLCLCMFPVCLSVCSSIGLSCLSVCLVVLSVLLFCFLSDCLSACLSVCLSVCSVCPSQSVFFSSVCRCPSVCFFFLQSVELTVRVVHTSDEKHGEVHFLY